MIFPVSKPSSMCWVRFNTWAVQDLPGRKSAFSGIRTCSITGDRRATTRACLQSLDKRSVLAHALSRLSTHCIVKGPKFLISSVRISSSPAPFPFFRCFHELCSSMIVNSSSKSWFSWPHLLILLCCCLFGTLPFRMS